MKTKIFAILLILFSFSISLNAAPAKPGSIQATQPDGTTIVIEVHGDEFLSWFTSGNSLVAQGDDGWWYYATFDADGNSVIGSQKVSASVIRQAAGTSQSAVVPPASAIEKANAERAARYSRLSTGGSSAAKGAPSQAQNSISLGSDNRFLVILVDFSDLKFSVNGGGENTRKAFDNLMNQDGYSANGAQGSVKDYFVENSHSKFVPTFDVYGPVTMPYTMSYYSKDKGETDQGVPAMLVEACKSLDKTVDFSKYDLDNDGKVDNVFIYFAGYNQAEGAPGTIWPHQWEAQASVYVDGKKIGVYSCSSEYRGNSGQEMAGIATFCHEFGHSIGLPDFYDTNNSKNGRDVGVYSVMSYGTYNANGKRPPYFNAEERYILGWVTDRPSPYGKSILKPIQEESFFYIPTLTANEYYLYEFRDGTGWDTGLEKGVLIYHVDKSSNIVSDRVTASSTWDNNRINSYSDHPCMNLLKASSEHIPFGIDKLSFTDKTNPAAKDWAGRSIDCDLKNIILNTNSATLEFNAEEIFLSGHIFNTSNEPVSGVKVDIYMTSTNSALSPFENSVENVPSLVTLVETLTTDSNGYYSTNNESIAGKEITVAVRKDGYKELSETFNFIRTSDLNFVLNKVSDVSKTTLKKHSGIHGNTDKKGAYYVAVKYSSSEIVDYVGWQIKSFTFGAERTGNEKVYVFVMKGEQTLYEKEVTSLLNPSGMTTVDISNDNFLIPASSDLYFGVRSSNSQTVYFFDNKTTVEGGAYYRIDSSWKSFSGTNYMMTVDLSLTNREILNISGVKMIDCTSENYQVGDKFTLSIDNSEASPYTAIEWKVNSEVKQDGSQITLEAGTTNIKATLTYPSGKTEVVLMKIKIDE